MAYAASADAGRPAAAERPHLHPERDLVVGIVIDGGPGRFSRGCDIAGGERGFRGDGASLGGQPLGPMTIGLGPLGVELVGQEWTAGERKGGSGGGPGRRGLAGGETPARLVDQLGQRIGVEPIGDQPVAHVVTWDAIGAEHAPQPAHEHGDLIVGSRRRAVTPAARRPAGRRGRLAPGQRQIA